MNEKLKRKIFGVIEGDFNKNKKKNFIGYTPLKRNNNNKNIFNINNDSLTNNENFNPNNQNKINELKYNSFKTIKPSQDIFINSYDDDDNILKIIDNYSNKNKKFYSNYFNKNNINKNFYTIHTNNHNNKNLFRSNPRLKTKSSSIKKNIFSHRNPINKIYDFTEELKTIQNENKYNNYNINTNNNINSNKISLPLNLKKKKFLANGAYVTNIFNDSENPYKKETQNFFSKAKKKNFLFESDPKEIKKREKKEKIEEFKEGFNLSSTDIEKYLKRGKIKKINLNLNMDF
jgi:hypothetical protein